MASTRQKLEALKAGRELPVDVRSLWRSTSIGDVPPPDERAVLLLARAIHRAESNNVATSWSAQTRAADYFNAWGLAGTLDEILRLDPGLLEVADG